MSRAQTIANMFLWLAAGVAFAAFIILLFVYITSFVPDVPSCQEDELIVGIGNFDTDGYWDNYICVHPDTIFNG